MKKFFSEFKDFISRGNVLDMAIGVIIATAFGKITTSLVNDLIMPAIGLLTGGTDFTEKLNWVVREPLLDEAGEVVSAGVTIGFGILLSAVINFIIIAFICFAIVKSFNRAQRLAEAVRNKKPEPAPDPTPAPPTQEQLLTEIRDLLKGKTEE